MASNLGGIILIFVSLVALCGLILWSFNVAKEVEDDAFANQTTVNTNYFPLLTELSGYMWTGLAIFTIVGIGLALVNYGRGEQ